MAQNITLLGASYSEVPSVLLPKTGGGTASFTDVTDTTAEAADVASGKYFYSSAGVRTQGTASGGGDGSDVLVVTLSYNEQTEMWEPDCTYAEVLQAGRDGKTATVQVDVQADDASADGALSYWPAGEGDEGAKIEYWVRQFTDGAVTGDDGNGIIESQYVFHSLGLTLEGTYNYSETGGLPTLQAKTATPTESQQTIEPDSGYDGLSSVTVGAIPSEYIIPSGSETKTANGTYDVTALAQLVVSVASPVKTATGTFTGNGTRTIDVTCAFEPDIVYFTSNPGTTASSGTVAAIIVRDMMAATRYRNNSTTNSHYAIPDIANLNTSGSSYSWRATYDNSKVTLYCYSSNARGLLTNGRTYTYTFIKWTN